MAILSLNQYIEKLKTSAIPSANTRPFWPPIAPPSRTNRPPRAAIRIQVLTLFRPITSTSASFDTQRPPPDGEGRSVLPWSHGTFATPGLPVPARSPRSGRHEGGQRREVGDQLGPDPDRHHGRRRDHGDERDRGR